MMILKATLNFVAWHILIFLLVFAFWSMPSEARFFKPASNAVDVQLVLAVDVSKSMDAKELTLQREGYIAAFRHTDIINAIKSGYLGRVAVTYFEWAGPSDQTLVVPWTMISDQETSEAFASQIRPVPTLGNYGTSISSSLKFALGLFDKSQFRAERNVIDVSGDGANNTGPPVGPIRDQVLARGITINGLPLMLDPTDDMFGLKLDKYYENCVIGGNGAFMISVTDMAEFATAVRRKILQELTMIAPRVMFAAGPGYSPQTSTPVPAPNPCGAGEPPRLSGEPLFKVR